MPYDPQLAKLRAVASNAFNLETLLGFACSGKETVKILEHIPQAVAKYFALEENTVKDLGVSIQQSHLDEHKEILEEIKQLETDWKKKIISASVFAEGVRIRIFFHIRDYDQPLADSILHPSDLR